MHVAVATYQDGRGNAVGRTRQLEKALRRLGPYAPSYEGIDIDGLLAWSRASLAAQHCGPLPEPADYTCRASRDRRPALARHARLAECLHGHVVGAGLQMRPHRDGDLARRSRAG